MRRDNPLQDPLLRHIAVRSLSFLPPPAGPPPDDTNLVLTTIDRRVAIAATVVPPVLYLASSRYVMSRGLEVRCADTIQSKIHWNWTDGSE